MSQACVTCFDEATGAPVAFVDDVSVPADPVAVPVGGVVVDAGRVGALVVAAARCGVRVVAVAVPDPADLLAGSVPTGRAVRIWCVPAREAAEYATAGACRFAPSAELEVPAAGLVVDAGDVLSRAAGLAPRMRVVVGRHGDTYRDVVGTRLAGLANLAVPRMLPRPADFTPAGLLHDPHHLVPALKELP